METAKKSEILRVLDLNPGDFDAISKAFPVKWPSQYLRLVQGNPLTHPIARMGRPSQLELQTYPDDLADPVGDRRKRALPWVVQKHPDRLILLVTKSCHFYCRFCFRRDDDNFKKPTKKDWDTICSHLSEMTDLREVILSGGDPLTLKDETLRWIIGRLGQIPQIQFIRIHSRAPVHFPQRITPDLIEALTSGLPVTLVTHFNHPVEMTEESLRGVGALLSAGIQVKNQSVLLNGVNDCPSVLLTLHDRMYQNGIMPYYIHHPDRVQGNALFRVTIERGKAIISAFISLLGDIPAPEYVLDLPDGRGKIPVFGLIRGTGGEFVFQHPDGTKSFYRDYGMDPMMGATQV